MHVLKKETAPRYVRPEGITSYLLASPRTSSAKHLTTTLAVIQPGDEQRIHSHPPEQVYFILEGRGLMTVGDETQRVGPDDCVFIPSGQSHGLKNDGGVTLRYFSAAASAYQPGHLEETWAQERSGDGNMTNVSNEHQRLILEQFTKQAVPFSQMQNHSPELLLTASGAGPEDIVLDVACGPGLMACAFAKVARHVTGIDLTPAMIEQAKVLQQSHSLTNLTWHVGDVLPLPYPAASFSLVFTRYSFHHFLDPKAVLAEMFRVCSQGGRVVVVDVFMSNPEQAESYNCLEKMRDPSHVRALALEELTSLFSEVGFQNVRSQLYKHEVEMEQVLQRSFPNPGDADKIRKIFVDDLGVNRLGVGAHRKDGGIHYAYPVAVLVGRK